MAVIDFNQHPDFDTRGFDLVIVGAGAAGLYLAQKVAAHARVLVLESGHFQADESRQVLNEVVQTGKPLMSAVPGRRRAIGGTTTAWAGQSLPFSRIDFQKRPWVRGAGWPISRDDLEDNYKAVNAAMGIDTLDYDADIFRLLNRESIPFDPATIHFHFSKWAPEPNFRIIFREAIRHRFTVLYNCHLLRIRIEGNRVQAIDVSNFEMHKAVVPISRLVLATGGLEANRILLNLDRETRFLPDRQRSLLGTGFMEHPSVELGEVGFDQPYEFQKQFNTQLNKRRKYSLRLSLSEAFQRTHHTLNASASIMMLPRSEEFDPYRDYRDLRRVRNWVNGNAFRTAMAFAFSARALLLDGFVYKHGAIGKLVVMTEQEPFETSRLTLHETERDGFGLPKLVVNWEISEETWRTIVLLAEAVQDEFDRLKLGRVSLYPQITMSNPRGIELLSDVNHHMGGTIMGSDRDLSVVDPELRLHSLGNLYVCSCSVFPSASHSNPTLTMLALTDRLANAFQERLRSGATSV